MSAATGEITRMVRNSAIPTSTWLDGVVCVPSACRRKCSTMVMRRNGVIDMTTAGQQRQQRQQNDDLHRDAQRLAGLAHVDAQRANPAPALLAAMAEPAARTRSRMIARLRRIIGPPPVFAGICHRGAIHHAAAAGRHRDQQLRPPTLTRCSECCGVSGRRSIACICLAPGRPIPFPLKRASPLARSQYNAPPSRPSTKRTASTG